PAGRPGRPKPEADLIQAREKGLAGGPGELPAVPKPEAFGRPESAPTGGPVPSPLSPEVTQVGMAAPGDSGPAPSGGSRPGLDNKSKPVDPLAGMVAPPPIAQAETSPSAPENAGEAGKETGGLAVAAVAGSLVASTAADRGEARGAAPAEGPPSTPV